MTTDRNVTIVHCILLYCINTQGSGESGPALTYTFPPDLHILKYYY